MDHDGIQGAQAVHKASKQQNQKGKERVAEKSHAKVEKNPKDVKKKPDGVCKKGRE